MTRSLIALSVSVALFGLALAELNAQAEPLDVHRGYGWPLREPPVVQTWSNTLFSTSPKAVSGMPTEFVRPNSALPSAANRGAAQRRLPGFGPIVGLVKPRVQPATDSMGTSTRTIRSPRTRFRFAPERTIFTRAG